MYFVAIIFLAFPLFFFSLRWAMRTASGVFLLPYLINCASILVSLMYLEAVPIYILELNIISFPNGSAASFLLSQYVFIGAVIYILHHLEIKHGIATVLPAERTQYRACVAFSVGLLIVLYGHLMISSGIPLFDEYVSKQTFWNSYARFPVLRSIFGNTSAFLPFVMGLAFYKAKSFKRNRRIGRQFPVFLLLVYLLYVILLGNKFGAIYFSLIYFVSPTLFGRILKREPVIRLREMIYAPVILTLIVLWVVQQYTGHPLLNTIREIGSSVDLLFYRAFGLTGELWWRVHQYVFFEGGSSLDNIVYLPKGLLYLMRVFGASRIDIDLDIELGVRFSDGNPAIGLLTFGPFGLVPYLIVTGALLAAVTACLAWYLGRGNLFEIVVALQLYGWYLNAVIMGDFDIFFNLRNLGLVCFLVVTFCVRRQRHVRIRRVLNQSQRAPAW